MMNLRLQKEATDLLGAWQNGEQAINTQLTIDLLQKEQSKRFATNFTSWSIVVHIIHRFERELSIYYTGH